MWRFCMSTAAGSSKVILQFQLSGQWANPEATMEPIWEVPYRQAYNTTTPVGGTSRVGKECDLQSALQDIYVDLSWGCW